MIIFYADIAVQRAVANACTSFLVFF